MECIYKFIEWYCEKHREHGEEYCGEIVELLALIELVSLESTSLLCRRPLKSLVCGSGVGLCKYLKYWVNTFKESYRNDQDGSRN
jgi:hypothetical protein